MADWLAVYGIVWNPLRLTDWLRDHTARANLGVGAAWRITKTCMQDTERSRCWAALTGAWRLSTHAEELAWAQYAAEGRVTKGKDYRPWLDTHADPFRAVLVRDRTATNRDALREQFGITE